MLYLKSSFEFIQARRQSLSFNYYLIACLSIALSACATDPNFRHPVEFFGKTKSPLEVISDAADYLAKQLEQKGCPQIGSIKVKMISSTPDFSYAYENRWVHVTNGSVVEIWNVWACHERSYYKVTHKSLVEGGSTIEPTENQFSWWSWETNN